jgi:hypothetical protein
MAFLAPALAFARTQDPKILANLPQEEQEAARRIAAGLTKKTPAG